MPPKTEPKLAAEVNDKKKKISEKPHHPDTMQRIKAISGNNTRMSSGTWRGPSMSRP